MDVCLGQCCGSGIFIPDTTTATKEGENIIKILIILLLSKQRKKLEPIH
jgi:hypothetical protein